MTHYRFVTPLASAHVAATAERPWRFRMNLFAAEGAKSQRRENWARVALLPGLELHVREGAGAIVERLAAEIAGRYGITRGVETAP